MSLPRVCMLSSDDFKRCLKDLPNCKVKHTYLVDDAGEPLNIVSNKGLKRFEKAYVSRNGEYHGFCVEAQEDIPPVITDHHIKLALEHILQNDIEKSAQVLSLMNEYKIHGDGLVYFVVDEWLKSNKISPIFKDLTKDFDASVDKELRSKLVQYINTERHHPINGKIKIVDIGTNTKTRESVVPPDWIGRVFSNATELHEEMNKLPNRKGKPPVCYCCIYSNSIKHETVWIDKSKIKTKDVVLTVSFDKTTNNIVSVYNVMSAKSVGEISANTKLIQLNTYTHTSTRENFYVCVDERLIDRTANREKTESVGYLSSLLQKCIRRGSHNGTLLAETCRKLNNSPNYNLPDHNFATVSGARQLTWRAYISIVEDVKGYTVDPAENCDAIDMRSLVLLSIIFQRDPSIKLSNLGVKIVTSTLLSLQVYTETWSWRKFEQCDLERSQLSSSSSFIDQIKDSIVLAAHNMPMMANDRLMLEKVMTYTLKRESDIHNLSHIKSSYDVLQNCQQDVNEQKETRYVAMDMHCRPTILIEIQGMLDLSLNNEFVTTKIPPPTLEALSHYIWENFSGKNIRYPAQNYSNIIKKTKTNSKIDDTTKAQLLLFENNVYDCVSRHQEHLIESRVRSNTKTKNSRTPTRKITAVHGSSKIDTKEKVTKSVGRTTWLSLFGQKDRFSFKNKVYDVFFGGVTRDDLCKVKKTVKGVSEYVEGDIRGLIQESYLEKIHNVKRRVTLPDPPEGYRWIDQISKANFVTTHYDHDRDEFYVNDIPVTVFDLTELVEPVPNCIEAPDTEIDDETLALVRVATYSVDKNTSEYTDFGTDIIYRLREVADHKRLDRDNTVFCWTQYVSKTKLNLKLWKIVLARVYTSDIDGEGGRFTLSVGPCDRRGKKTNNSISYEYEGSIYRTMCMLETLYPYMIRRKQDSMRWSIDKTLPEFQHMMNSIKMLCETDQMAIYNSDVQINTELWKHQERSSDRIFRGYVHDKKRGFGDASHVGAGKTLCALNVCRKLYEHNKTAKNKYNTHSGFLVLVPSIQLIKTWTDEVSKHTSGFELFVQNAEGSFNLATDTDTKKTKQIDIKPHTIVVSTMGRVRDHPVQHPWILVIVDECLSVQNKEALQTEEAWRQSCYSEYGVLLLSATFFRSRFDKMLYMLKMLKTHLPETREYLDAILNESIVSNVTESTREWEVSIDRIYLTKTQREEYDEVYRSNSGAGSEVLFTSLTQYIHNNVDYIKIFYDQLTKLEKLNKRVLIFTKSKKEADSLVSLESASLASTKKPRVSRYPDKSGVHTVLSLSEGTYGLNDLVIYDTILMRPPEPDKLPQIKGRLDRPGQKASKLRIQYVLLKDTIEEAGVLRLEMCNNFYNNYLMPLAEFYDLAVKCGRTDQGDKIDEFEIDETPNIVKKIVIESKKTSKNKNIIKSKTNDVKKVVKKIGVDRTKK